MGNSFSGKIIIIISLCIFFVHANAPETQFVQPAFVFDENVPVKIPVQTSRRQNRMTIWLQQMHLGIHQLPEHGFTEEKPYPCTASAVSFMLRAL